MMCKGSHRAAAVEQECKPPSFIVLFLSAISMRPLHAIQSAMQTPHIKYKLWRELQWGCQGCEGHEYTQKLHL